MRFAVWVGVSVLLSAAVSVGAPNPEASAAWRKLERCTAPVCGVRVGFTLGLAGSKDADATTVSHGQMGSMTVATNANVVTVIWKGHPKCGEGFTVTARLTLQPEGGFEYSGFSYSGNESPFFVRRIVFPEVVVPRTDKTTLFTPHFVGEVLHPDWSKTRPGQTLTSDGPVFLVYRCIASMDGDAPSHFLDQRGEARRYPTSMQIKTCSAPGWVVLRNVYEPPVTDALRKAGTLPFTGVYAPYRGGWYEAARMHRAWMEKQPWFRAAAARDFSKLRSIALWMWSRGGIGVSEPPVHWFMRETGLKVALDWYWWHNVPYDTCYPFFWPPRDGEAAFRAAVKRMRDAGAFVQVYTNGMLWDCDDPRWADGGIDNAMLLPNGSVFSHVYNPFTKQAQAHNCGEAPKFQRMMRDLEKTLASTGLDGVYMDMISCAAHSVCFNPRHAHPPGGGSAVTDGYRAYVQAVRDDNPGFLLSSEGTSEAYCDLFESAIVLYSSWERNNLGTLPLHEPVPAVSVIYRGAMVLFGSFATPGGIPGWDPLWGKRPDGPEVEAIAAQYPDQFAVEFARGVVWGIQPMVHNFTMADLENPRLADDIRFMKDTARFYYDHRDYLFDGEMLRPAKLECASKRVDFLSAGSYKRPKDASRFTQSALPAVFHSEWRAPDGRQAAILANWTREEQAYTLDLGNGTVRRGSLAPRSWRCEVFPGR